MIRAFLCVWLFGGHEFYRTFDRTWRAHRLYQRCVLCGHETRGWDLTPALRFRSTWMRKAE